MPKYLKAPGLPVTRFEDEHADRLLAMPNNGGWTEVGAPEEVDLTVPELDEGAETAKTKSGHSNNRKTSKGGPKGNT